MYIHFKNNLTIYNVTTQLNINDFRIYCFLHCKFDKSPHLSENKVNLAHARKSMNIRSAQERRKSVREGPLFHMITK